MLSLCTQRAKSGPVSAPAHSGTNLADINLTTFEGLPHNLPYKGVDYLGMGYDIYVGNPVDGGVNGQGNVIDPGIRRPVAIVTTTDQDVNTTDYEYTMPAEGYAFPITSCSMASATQKVKSSKNYQKSLSQDVSVGGGYGGRKIKVNFQASVGWNSFKRQTASNQTTRYETKSYCLLYEVGYDQDKIPQPVRPFKTHCDTLRELTNKHDDNPEMRDLLLKAWNQFFTTWGTHYMSVVRLGGKMIHRVDTTKTSTSSFEKKGLNVDAALSAKVFKFNMNASYSQEKKEQNEEALSNLDIKESVVFIGGLPAQRDLDNPSVAFAEWAQTVRDQPMPVQYKLMPLCYVGWDVRVYDLLDENALLDMDLSKALINPKHYNKYLYEYEKYAIDLAAKRWVAEQLTLPVFDRMLSFSESQNHMVPEDRMLSDNGKWKCQLELTGHLVIAKKLSDGEDADDEADDEWEDAWSTENQEDVQSRTTMGGANYVFLGPDGILTLYEMNSSGQPFEQYSIGTGRGIEPYLVMQDNGLLVCFDQSRQPLWYAGPGEPGPWNYDAHEGSQCTGSRKDILRGVEAPNATVCGMKCDMLKEKCTGFVHVLKTAESTEFGGKCFLRQGVVSKPEKYTNDDRNCYTSKWAKAQQCALDYCNAHGDLKTAFCGGQTCGTGAAAAAALQPGEHIFGGNIGNDRWKLVRRVKAGEVWHPAKDRLKGTETYGTYDPSYTSDQTFSIPFPSGCSRYLLATGDMTKWMIVDKSAVDGTYSNEDRAVVRSSTNNGGYKAKWYNRAGVTEDPWISLTDHDDAVAKGDILYGEGSFGNPHAKNVLPEHDGANVFCLVATPAKVAIAPQVEAAKCLNHWDEYGKKETRTNNPDQCMRKGWKEAKKQWDPEASDIQTVTIPPKSRKHGACWVNPLLDTVEEPIFASVANTTSWDQANERCVTQGQRLCTVDDICPSRSSGATPKGGVQDGLDRWVAVEGDNQWVQVGNQAWPSCQLHTEINGGSAGKPSWGITKKVIKERVIGACCSDAS